MPCRSIHVWLKLIFISVVFMFLLLLIGVSPISHATDNQEVKVYDIQNRVDAVFLRVRDDISGGKLLLRSEPNIKSPVVFALPNKSIIQVNLSFDEIVAREKNEKDNSGSWQKITTSNGQNLYFYDYWQNLTTLFNTSRGISLLQRKNSNENLFVFDELPQNLNFNCENSNLKCLRWADSTEHIYLIESKIVAFQAAEPTTQKSNSHQLNNIFYHLLYRVRFVKDENGESVSHQGWVFARQLDLRLDDIACQKEVCLNSALLANRPEDVQNLFFELGYIKRPTKEKQIFDGNFYAVKKFNLPNSKGERPFNRWIDRMIKEVKNPEQYDEIGYLLKVRPLWLLGVGYSSYDFAQSGAKGAFKLTDSGPTLTAGLTFPLLLDLEILVKGSYTQSEFKISSDTQNKFNPVEITNDLILTIPMKNRPASYFLGPGMTYRTKLNSSSRIGYNTLYGLHLASGFFYGSLSGYVNLGFTTIDITGSLSHPEWQTALGYTFKYTPQGAWSSWLQHSSFDAVTRDKDAISGAVQVTNYQSTRTTLSVHYDF